MPASWTESDDDNRETDGDSDDAAFGVPVLAANLGLNCSPSAPIGRLKNEQFQPIFGCQFHIKNKHIGNCLAAIRASSSGLHCFFFEQKMCISERNSGGNSAYKLNKIGPGAKGIGRLFQCRFFLKICLINEQ